MLRQPRPNNTRRLTDPHFSEAALAQLDLQAEGFSRDFPGVLGESLSLRLDGWAHGGQSVAKAVRVFWTEARGRSHKLVTRLFTHGASGSKLEAEETGGAREEQRVGAADPRSLRSAADPQRLPRNRPAFQRRRRNSAGLTSIDFSTGLLRIKGGICSRRRSARGGSSDALGVKANWNHSAPESGNVTWR